MQRSRLKNIINKSKEMSNKSEPVGSPYDRFIETLPKEMNLNFLLQVTMKKQMNMNT